MKESEAASSSTEDKSVSQLPVEEEVVAAGNQSVDPPEVGSADLPPTGSDKPSDLNFPEKSPAVQVEGKCFPFCMFVILGFLRFNSLILKFAGLL